MIVDLFLGLYLLLLAPKFLWDRIRGKRHPHFLQRLGIGLPQPDRPVIWIHAVSVGEVKAAEPLFRKLKQEKSDAFFLITTTTATGQAEAKRSLSEAHAFTYLPLDFTVSVRRFVKHFNPSHFILIESDIWPNLIKALAKNGTTISLVSGKVSERSARRFRLFAPFSKQLFAHFTHICVQNELYYQRFFPLLRDPSRLFITGNLKLDLTPKLLSQPLPLPEPAITISCTHAPEEEWILDALQDGPWFLLLAPRHPERFQSVAALLEEKKIPFARWGEPLTGKRLLLVDRMGQLPLCYSNSQLAILGGSFVDHIGGHNVLEPCLYGLPVLFGPHMFGQMDFAQRAIETGAGIQLPLAELRNTVTELLSDPDALAARKKAAFRAVEAGRGATERTIEKILEKKNYL